jgi:S1-C subfamily serine protease
MHCALSESKQMIVHSMLYMNQRRRRMPKIYSSKNRISAKGSIQSYWPVILGILLSSVFFFGCGQQEVSQPDGYINLNRVGDKTIPATVYIEVVDHKAAVEPLPSFTADPLFFRYFDVERLQRQFSDELAGQGSGMIIDAQGHILTNNHVVSGATKIDVRLATGRWCSAKLIGTDPQTDLAVIRIVDQVALPHVTFGDSDHLTVGEPVASVGYLGRMQEIQRPRLTPTVFGGIIRQTQPNGISYCSVCPDYWSTDAGHNPGHSGALLLNRQGEVVGIDVAIMTQPHEKRTIGFAIPGNTAVRIAEQLIKNYKGGNPHV